jgi:hypothetical protein
MDRECEYCDYYAYEWYRGGIEEMARHVEENHA